MVSEIEVPSMIARVPGTLIVVASLVAVGLAIYAVYYLIFRLGKGPQD
jgi:hypothetical protein